MNRIRLEDIDAHQPDPAWDYAQIWDYLKQMQAKLTALRTEIAKLEDASAESDAMVQQHLKEIQVLCFRALANIMEHPPNQNK